MVPRRDAVLVLALFALACGGGGTDPDPPVPVDCSAVAPTSLNPGQHAIIDPRTNFSCLRLPAPPVGGAEYLVASLSTAGNVTPAGVSDSYELEVGVEALAAVRQEPGGQLDATEAVAFGRDRTGPAGAFHARLRRLESAIAGSPSAALGTEPVAARAIPPTLGDMRTFSVCANVFCSSFVSVSSEAVYVGTRGAIYLDQSVPAMGFTAQDIAEVGALFDGPGQNMYAIDTTAFGGESDVDANSVVIILLTDAVNALSPNCLVTGSRILGYFFGLDLLAGQPNSNGGEIFYSAVPDPTNAGCPITRNEAMRSLGPTFIHEFQHMISFNQHRLIGGSLATEETWLNEGLSHFAEELGGRLLPDDGTALGSAPDRETQFFLNNFANAYDYLVDPESHFLITPDNSSGTLEERGATWLFVRWLADQFGAGVAGTDFTRAIVRTNRVGVENVETVTGEPFSTTIPQWQMANYLDNLPAFTPGSQRLTYRNWDMRAEFAALNQTRPSSFPRPYPLVPDAFTGTGYERLGTLRAGSGPHLRVALDAGEGPVAVRLTRQDGSAQEAGTGARVVVTRIR